METESGDEEMTKASGQDRKGGILHRIFRTQQAGIAAVFVAGATILSTVLGLMRDKVMAYYFGAGLETDFYNYGITIPDMLQNVLIMGVTSASFIPMLSEYVNNYSREEASRMASSFLNITLAVFSLTCLTVGIFMPEICNLWLDDKIEPGARDAIVLVARIFLGAQIAFAVSKIFSGILQTHKHFMAYALALLVYNPAIILGMVFFHETHGIYSAAYGALFGACFVLIVNMTDLFTTEYKYVPALDFKHKGLRKIYSLAIPNYLNMGLLHLVFLVYSKISFQIQEGSYSAFRYAFNFESFPVSIFGISFVTAIFPFLSENASKQNFKNYNYNLQNSLRQVLFLTVPSGIGMAFLSEEIIGLVLGGGKFGSVETTMTASILFFYALAIPLESMWYLFARAFYALKDTWTPFWYRLIGTIINLGLSYYLAFKIGPSAFSIGILAAFSIQIVLFLTGLKQKVAEFDLRVALIILAKISFCAVIMGIAVFSVNAYLTQAAFMQDLSGRMQYLLRTSIGIASGILVYIPLTVVFKCADFTVFSRVLARILNRPQK